MINRKTADFSKTTKKSMFFAILAVFALFSLVFGVFTLSNGPKNTTENGTVFAYDYTDLGTREWKFTALTSKHSNGYYEALIIQYLGTDTSVTIPTIVSRQWRSGGQSGTEYYYVIGTKGTSTQSVINSSITSITFPENEYFTSIGDYSFNGCAGLTSIKVPNNVNSIGQHAFDGCTNLINEVDNCKFLINTISNEEINSKYALLNGTDISGEYEVDSSCKIIAGFAFANNSNSFSFIADGQIAISSQAFAQNNKLQNITINNLINIGIYAFKQATNLSSVELRGNITSIGKEVFAGCTKLTSITIPDGVTDIGERAFQGCTGLQSVTIPDSVTSIGDSVFSNCTGLESITIPDSVTSIGHSVFSGCTGLESITIPDSVTSIGYSAFPTNNTNIVNSENGVYYLKNTLANNTVNTHFAVLGVDSSNKPSGSYTVNENCRILAVNAFNNCTGLQSVTISDSVTSIGDGAFYGCTGLESITIPDSVTSIDGNAFSGCTGLKMINSQTDGIFNIPNNVASIGSNAFNNCTQLKSISISHNVTRISSYMFYGCTGLTNMTIPDCITTIGSYAFQNCNNLVSMTIPESVINIEDNAFLGFSSLKEIYVTTNVNAGYSHRFYNNYYKVNLNGLRESMTTYNMINSSMKGWHLVSTGAYNENKVYTQTFNLSSRYASPNAVLYADSTAEILPDPYGRYVVSQDKQSATMVVVEGSVYSTLPTTNMGDVEWTLGGNTLAVGGTVGANSNLNAGGTVLLTPQTGVVTDIVLPTIAIVALASVLAYVAMNSKKRKITITK